MPNTIPAELKGAGVLVTGTSSGIGRASALYLADQGFTVFATVRKEADYESLCSLNHPNLVPVYPLDLTRHSHLPAVVETIEREMSMRGKNGLYAVLNNAGGGGVEPVELMDLDGFRFELETRLVGPVGLLQALLPMIRRAQGRILWIATPGLMAIPYLANIHACDYAMTCIADTLHYELSTWQIPSILIKCGGIQTAAVERTAQELAQALQTWPEDKRDLYAGSLHRNQERLAKFDEGRTAAIEVAKVVFKALTARKPRRRYYVGSSSGMARLVRFMPQRLIDAVFTNMA